MAGYAEIKPDTIYPPKGHPSGYYFTWDSGRKLNEFQIVYITDGYGVFETRENIYTISPGTIITLHPDVWHRYKPKQNTGWKEYYAGFQGSFANQHIMKKYSQFLKKPVVYNGFKEKILDIYKKMIEYR